MTARAGRAGLRRRAARSALRRGALAAHNFVKPAEFAAGRLVLIDERQAVFIELAEPLVPRGSLERGLRPVWKVDAQDSDLAATFSPADRGRHALALFHPSPDLFVVGGHSRFCATPSGT